MKRAGGLVARLSLAWISLSGTPVGATEPIAKPAKQVTNAILRAPIAPDGSWDIGGATHNEQRVLRLHAQAPKAKELHIDTEHEGGIVLPLHQLADAYHLYLARPFTHYVVRDDGKTWRSATAPRLVTSTPDRRAVEPHLESYHTGMFETIWPTGGFSGRGDNALAHVEKLLALLPTADRLVLVGHDQHSSKDYPSNGHQKVVPLAEVGRKSFEFPGRVWLYLDPTTGGATRFVTKRLFLADRRSSANHLGIELDLNAGWETPTPVK